jgi:hypothetical protein
MGTECRSTLDSDHYAALRIGGRGGFVVVARMGEALELLFKGYLNEDWQYEGATPDEVVSRFVREAEPETVVRARQELDRLLAESSDAELEATMYEEWHFALAPGHFGLTLRAMLSNFAAILRAS